MLSAKKIVLGVTGGVAAYKMPDLVSYLMQKGAQVQVMMTEAATRIVTPVAFKAISGQPVITSFWPESSGLRVGHVEIGATADLVVIAPATANTIAKIANGFASDIVSATVLATTAPVIVAPSMNVNMWHNQATQRNIAILKEMGVTVIEPAYGRLATGISGKGRLVPLEEIVAVIEATIEKGLASDVLSGKKVVVTAGGTREPIDPVRYVGNRSSGKMGYAIAEVARRRGASVTLISGPVSMVPPSGVELVGVQTARQMLAAVTEAVKGADVLVMAAAVADYQPIAPAPQKIKKDSTSFKLELERTPDILSEVTGDFIRVGFAAESENLLANARRKLQEKRLDLIVANDITAEGSGFGSETNQVTLIDANGEESWPLLSKREVAERLLDRVIAILK